MDYQITYPHKGFKTIKLKGCISNLFVFKNKSRVHMVALISQIAGYIVFFIGLYINIKIYLLPEADRMKFLGEYVHGAIAIGVIGVIYELLCMGIYKFLNNNNAKLKEKDKSMKK